MEPKPHLTVLGFGVRFELWFFITAAIIGVRMSDLKLAGLWIALVTISILVHELGHALAYRYYGAKARISMHGLGGLTHGRDADHLAPKQRIVVSLAGSTVEMLLLGGPAWILQQFWTPGGYVGTGVHWLVWINIVWALVNLAPVWPMDGGHILDELLFMRSGESRRQLVYRISMVTGTIAAVVCYLNGLRFGIFLFGYFVVISMFGAGMFSTKRNYQLWPGMTTHDNPGRSRTPRARKETTKDVINRGYGDLRNGATTYAQSSAQQVIGTSKSKRTVDEASEILVWSSLVAGRSSLAAEDFAALDKPSQSLAATMTIEAGDDRGGIAALAKAIQLEAALPCSEQAILHAGRTGHITHVVEALLADGTVGLGHAVRVQHLLEQAGLDDAHRAVEALI